MEDLTGRKLSEAEIAEELKELKDWRREGNAITKTFKLDSFLDAIGFVNEVADFAEELDHHPDILIQYNKVTLTLSTHSAGGLTDKDIYLAQELDAPEPENPS